jgi:hypothetical protein
MSFHRDNHYVSRLYLKRFAASDGRILTYRTLVAHPRVHVWKPCSAGGVAYRAHLYTRIAYGVETDEIETWLSREFEAPAEDALRKATADTRLSRTDWHNLVRFLAVQDVRTPARLAEILRRAREVIPDVLQDSLRNSVHKLELAKRSREVIRPTKTPNSEYIPLRVTTEIEPGQEFGKIKAEVVVGRGIWLYTIRRLLMATANVLHDQRWSILSPPDGLSWFTSDDPVIRLNYYADGEYDFKGGWGNPGTEILLPLDPRHLLYTKVGERSQSRASIATRGNAQMIRRFIAEHAHRIIFAASADMEILELRPRTVDANLVRSEDEQWRRWHEDQTAAERELMGGSAR